jgi:excinuclease ABC subunit A
VKSLDINLRGASEHNLKNVDVEIGDGHTVVTGVSGSGKTSLVFDTLYHEARRRFLDIYLIGRSAFRTATTRLAPAKVESITGLGPAIAVGQNLLNRNPLSTLATASGLHPFLRLLYTNYGVRHCPRCGAPLSVLSEDEIVERLLSLSKQHSLKVYAPLMYGVEGSHRTLLKLLAEEFGAEALCVDGDRLQSQSLNPEEPHDLEVEIGQLGNSMSAAQVRELVQRSGALGALTIKARSENLDVTFSSNPICAQCGTWFGNLEPKFFHTSCPYCKGEGCERCDQTGLHPSATTVQWEEYRLLELLSLTVDEVRQLFAQAELPSTARRLRSEIVRRLDALHRVGLGYIALDRSSPTLSRGESQRVRLAIALISRLEDMLHVLDEPTIGQHPADVARFLPAFRDLPGPVVYVEHDRVAAAAADWVVDLGPGAGKEGGEVTFAGTPEELWKTDTPTGRYFSMRDQVQIPEPRMEPKQFLTIRGACQHNLKNIDIDIPLGRLTVITGVSGSGKSTLVEHVLVPSLAKKKPIGCSEIEDPEIKPVLVDQTPIGKNPRSNPATYTKLSDIIRDLFAAVTGLSASHFSFNRLEGACSTCKGMGAIEAKMRYLPSIWIRCSNCNGQRFKEEVLAAKVTLGDKKLSIAEFYELSISEVKSLLAEETRLPLSRIQTAQRILQALSDVGLDYLSLGQPSPTLSGGEAQRVKLTKYLGRNKLEGRLIVLDEPSTGLHPQDLNGLLTVLDRLVRVGATIVVVEHNTDIIRAADWIIDLGPGAGPEGGQVIYAGPPDGLIEVEVSITSRALKEESKVHPHKPSKQPISTRAEYISIRNARANNLKGVNVDIPKGKLIVVTGVSGSGKSSLVGSVLEAESRRRFLESISMYERQGTREGPEAPVDSISGLGVTLTVGLKQPHMWTALSQFTRRATVGTATELSHHIGVLLARLGEQTCMKCGAKMIREEQWKCPECEATAPIAKPRHFSTSNYAAVCPKCTGIGSLQMPQPEKLIIHPNKPLCNGAMYSPGYWPQTYLCKDHPVILALGARYGFDPFKTPWNEMTKQAKEAFLFGDGKSIAVTYQSKSKGEMKTWTGKWEGFYGGWVRDWDVHGTYTKMVQCPECEGAGLRPEFLVVTLGGFNVHELSGMSLNQLTEVLEGISSPVQGEPFAGTSLGIARQRLRFLQQVGLGYLHLNRPTGTLSAGEAERVKLAGLLGSGLTSLTVLLDEPSRGVHPSELEALLEALRELRDEGNTVIVVEHDLLLIRAADWIIDLGPGAGTAGGKIVANGTLQEIVEADTLTGKWLRGEQGEVPAGERRPPRSWLTIKGARANNLRGETVKIPLGTLTGICGVSGSGKSTLLIDTLGRALVHQKYTTSFATEALEPGKHDVIEGAPARVLLVDQSRRGIGSPSRFLGLTKPLLKMYADGDDAKALGIEEKQLSRRCKACKGRGRKRIEMGFLPDVFVECEACRGTGYTSEAWEVKVKGVALPEVNELTFDEVYEVFSDNEEISRPLRIIRALGLGYLVWHQPAYTLSGGEIQRLKIAKELLKRSRRRLFAHDNSLYILDEPTVGQHMEDVLRLTQVLHRLVDAGHTVVVIEHHLHVLASCDWLIELGPGGGPEGGSVIAAGRPEEVARMNTPTALYLREVLETKE